MDGSISFLIYLSLFFIWGILTFFYRGIVFEIRKYPHFKNQLHTTWLVPDRQKSCKCPVDLAFSKFMSSSLGHRAQMNLSQGQMNQDPIQHAIVLPPGPQICFEGAQYFAGLSNWNITYTDNRHSADVCRVELKCYK